MGSTAFLGRALAPPLLLLTTLTRTFQTNSSPVALLLEAPTGLQMIGLVYPFFDCLFVFPPQSIKGSGTVLQLKAMAAWPAENSFIVPIKK